MYEVDEQHNVLNVNDGFNGTDVEARLNERKRREEYEGREDHDGADEDDVGEENDEDDVGEEIDVGDTRIGNDDRLRDEGPIKSDVPEPIVRLKPVRAARGTGQRDPVLAAAANPLMDASAGGQR